MKFVKKALLVAVAAVMMVMSFAACGDNNQKNDGNGSDKVLKIGGIGPVTGAAAQYGEAVKNGAELAVKEINEAGGVKGYQLEFKWEDDESDAEKAINAYNTLKDWGMQVLLGTVTSTPCEAVVERTHEDNMFQLTPSGSSVDAIKYDNAFRVCFTDPTQGTLAADYIAESGVAKKVAVIYNSQQTYSTGIYENFAAECKEKGIDVVCAEAFTDDSATDFSVQIQKVKESGAELLFLPMYYQEAALILKQSNTAGLNVKFFGGDGLDGLIKQLGDDVALADGVLLLTPFFINGTDEKTTKFVADYRETYKIDPNQFAADAYDGVYAIKAALEKAEITDPSIGVSELGDKLKAAFTEIEIAGLTGNMTWSADGEPSKSPIIITIQNGDYVSVQ